MNKERYFILRSTEQNKQSVYAIYNIVDIVDQKTIARCNLYEQAQLIINTLNTYAQTNTRTSR